MSLTNTTDYTNRWNDIVVSFTLKMYVYDKNDEPVDFTDRAEVNGKNLLMNVPRIAQVREKQEGTGLTATRDSKVRLFNEDRFFNKPFPSTLKTIYGNTASFDLSKNSKHHVLFNRKVEFRTSISFKDGTTEEGVIGVFTAGVLSFGFRSSFIDLDLKNRSLPLRQEDSAARIKNGLNWYVNRPVKFLVEELVKLRFKNSSGVLPGDFIIPSKVEIESAASIAGSSGDQRVLSAYGRQPEQNSSGTWLNRSLITRAIATGVQTSDLSTVGTPDPLSSESKSYIYMGCDNELWVWNPSTEQSTSIDDSTLDSTDLIRTLWYSTSKRRVYGIAHAVKGEKSSSGQRTETIQIFVYNGSSFSVVSSVNAFMSYFCYRDGLSSGGGFVYGQQNGATQAGENIPIPYNQKLAAMLSRAANNLTVGFLTGASLPGVDSISEQSNATGTFETGTINATPRYFNGSVGAGGSSAHIRFTLNQKGFFVFSQFETAIYFANFSEPDMLIRKLNLQTNNLQTLTSAYADGSGNRLDPLCGCEQQNAGGCFIGSVYWNDSSGLTQSVTRIEKMTSGGGRTNIWDSSAVDSDQSYFTPLEMIHNDSKNEILVIFFDRDRVGSNDSYILATQSDSAASSDDVSVIDTRNMQLKGFVRGSGNEANVVYMYEVGTGKGYKFDWDTDTLTQLDDGFSFVDNEYGLSCPDLAIDPDTRSGNNSNIVYGVSGSNLINEAYASFPTLKNWLCKYDKFYSGRIPLAKFEEMSVWQALEYLAQLANYKTGFDRQGRFYFVSNAIADTQDFDFNTEDRDGRIIDLMVTTGENNVFNLVRITPYSVILPPPEWEMKLVSRPSIEAGTALTELDEKPFDSEIQIQQKDSERKTLRLECMRGGLISEGLVIMRYRNIDQKFETSLLATYTAGGTTLRIASGIDTVRAGDTLRIAGSGNEEEITVQSTPSAANKQTGTVTLVSGFSNSYAIGDFIEITNNMSEWSNSNLNMLKDPFLNDYSGSDELNFWTESDPNIDAEETSTAGEFIYGESGTKLSLNSGTDEYIYQTIASSKLSASTNYTFAVEVRSFEGDSTENPCEVEIKITGLGAIESTVTTSTTSKSFVRLAVTAKTTASPSGNVLCEIHVKGTATAVAFVDGAIFREGVFGHLDNIGLSNDVFLKIGSSNVEVKFTAQSEETKMRAGDQLVITCPGLDNQKEEASVQTYIDTTSRGKYGEIAFPEINNPFLSRSLARDVGKRLLNAYAFPRYRMRLVMPLLPTLDFINSSNKIVSVNIRAEELFGYSGSWSEKGQVVSIDDDFRNGMTTVELIGSQEE